MGHALAFCVLSPFGRQQVAARTGINAMFLLANFSIAHTTGNYFAAPAESNPLLHTWSLSVEEQFYLMFPAILLLGWVLSRRGRRIRWVTVLVAAVALMSFWLAAAGVWPELRFYGPFARSWEFAVGALLALATTRRWLSSEKHVRLLAWLGVALLVASAYLIDKTTPFPGPWTLLPVGGTLLLIAAGTQHATWVTRALTYPAIVTIGDWSYSIYLWHWPLKVFAVTLWPEVQFAGILAAILSILPAVASYRWVEQPLRRLPQLPRRRTIALIAAVLGPPILLADTVSLAAVDYWQPRYKSSAMITHPGNTGWEGFYAHLTESYYPCSDQSIRDTAPKWRAPTGEEITRCRQSKPDSRIDVALVGDSHVEHLFEGMAEAIADKNVVYYIGGAASPFGFAVDGLPMTSWSGMDRIINHVASDPGIKTVVVSAAWAKEGVKPDDLVKMLGTFISSSKSVFVTDDVPMFDFDVMACKYRIAPLVPFSSKCSEDRKRFAAEYARYYPELKAAVDKVPGVQLLNTARYFCDDEVCRMTSGQSLLYRDQNHLNLTGSRFVVDHMMEDYQQFRGTIMRP